jgi:hypothetical protein
MPVATRRVSKPPNPTSSPMRKYRPGLGRSLMLLGYRQREDYAVAAIVFLLWKHSLQNTGRPWVGLKGTVVSRPQWEQFVVVSTRPGPEGAPPCRFALHALQRFGSFLNALSWKKCCSPAVNVKSTPQSTQVRVRSSNCAIPCAPQRTKGWLRISRAPALLYRFTLLLSGSFSGSVCVPKPV